jgi:hypothetical protein
VSTARRVVAVALVAVVLAALALAGRDHGAHTDEITAGAAADVAAAMPSAAPAAALSSTFYCAGGAADGSDLDASIVVANPTDRTVRVTVTVFPSAVDGDANGAAAVAALQPKATSFAVATHTRNELRLADVQQSPFAAALVEVDSGLVAVERRVNGKRGLSTGPCASSTSGTWYVPSGVTTMDARELLAVFNPFADDAVVDISFATSDGFRGPPATQGYVVPARHVSLVDVGIVAGRHDQVATQIVARRGRVVVDRLQTFNGSGQGKPAAVAATLAAPELAPVWIFPQGYVADGLRETYALFNPAAEAATVDLEIALADPETNGTTDPIPVTVPADGYVLVAMDQQARIPQGIAHSVTVRVRAGPDVVAERVLVASGAATRAGYGPALGSPLVSRAWLFADGRADETTADWLTLFNPSTDSIARADVAELAQGQAVPIDGLQRLEVPPGGRVEVELGSRINRAALPFVVTADLPLVAERGLFASKGPGLCISLGIPLPDGLARAPRTSATTTTTTAPP